MYPCGGRENGIIYSKCFLDYNVKGDINMYHSK